MMIENFLREYARLIVEYPEKIDVQRVHLDENFVEFIILADKADAGKLIGKDGKMINAIKTVVLASKSKDTNSYRVTVKALG